MTTEKEGDKEAFLSRWSRRKEEARQQPPASQQKPADPAAPLPELPPVDKLTLDSDYRDFFHPKIDEGVRREALKKLFSDPHFNVMDGLDVYIDDYSKTEPIPAAMLAGLKQAQNILRWAKEDEEARVQETKLREEKAALEPPASGVSPVVDARVPDPEPAPVCRDDAESQPKS